MNHGTRDKSDLAEIRLAYAKKVMLAADVEDSRLEAALANVPREEFLDPGPWFILRPPAGYEMTPDDNPIHVYENVLVGILPEKGLNNGHPSSLTALISLGRIREGEHVVHIGAGLGYYTAIMAQLVGDNGRVTAIEYEHDLAVRAAANLSGYPQVRVIHGDGYSLPLETSDVIYVNAGAVRPANTWLDAMADGGRLVLPLTVSYTTEVGHAMTRGAVFLIERNGTDYSAHLKSEVAIYPCKGSGDKSSEAALVDAFKAGGSEKVSRLFRTDQIARDRCWLRGPGWALAYS